MTDRGWTRRELLESVSAMMTLAGTPLGTAERMAKAVFEQAQEEADAEETFSLLTMRTERQSFPLINLFINIDRHGIATDWRGEDVCFAAHDMMEVTVDFKALLEDCDPSRLPMTCAEVVTVEMYDERLTWEFEGLVSTVDVQCHVIRNEPAIGDSFYVYRVDPMYEETIVVAEMIVFGAVTLREKTA